MFYGWRVCFVSCAGNLMVVGGVTYIMNAFMEPMSALYGWSRAEMSVAIGIGTLLGTFSMPFMASLAMSHSLRLLTTAGMAIGGMAFMGLGLVSSLWLFTLLFGLAWVAGQACGGVVGNALMGNWFTRYRGQAFGIANLGTSLSGAILPFVALILIDLCDVSMAFLLIGGFILLLSPLCYIIVRDTPEELQLNPDGAETSVAAGAASGTITTTSWSELLRCRDAYLIGLSFGFGLLSAAGVLGQLKPRLADIGFSDYTAMFFMCLTALFAAFGKYAWGWLCDKKNPLFTAKALMLSNVLAMLLSFLPQNTTVVLLFAIIGGICMGGFWTVLPAIVAHQFGKQRFMGFYRFVSGFIMLKALGYPVMGLSYQWAGSYDAAYVFCTCILVLCTLMTFAIKEPQAQLPSTQP